MAVRAEPRTSGKSQTIERAALMLACFSAEEPHLTLADLAARLSLNQSTAYRYVATLQAAGLLERDARCGGYRLGLRVIELSNIALNQLDVRKVALDAMDVLRDALDLMVSLGVPFEGDVLHVAHAAPREWPRWHTTVGRRAVAHCTSLGKVLLAHQPWEDVRALIAQYGWRPYTPHSIQDEERLVAELAVIWERGYAIDQEERRRGQVCIGAPIRDHTGAVIAALSVSGRLERLPEERWDTVAQQVMECADRISFHLGDHGSAAYL